MIWRSAAAIGAACCIGLYCCRAAEDAALVQATGAETAGAAVRYVPLDAPAGTSQAVVVQNLPLIHTRQLLPLDREGQVVGDGTVETQIEQLLDNLDAVLTAAGSGLNQLVRLNVYAIAPPTVDGVREQLRKRLDPAVRPAMTAVLTPLPHRQALVALDAVAVAAADSSVSPAAAVNRQRCEAICGNNDYADWSVLPSDGAAYLSGIPAEGGLAESAIGRSMTALIKTLTQLQLTPAHVVQLKVFLRPATSSDAALQELKKFFPEQILPPVVFVEWIALAPVEIELIAQLPPADQAAPHVQYYTPPGLRPVPTFSRVALVRGSRQIYTAGLFARTAGRGEDQARDVFAQLQTILDQTGSDLRHLAKASYFVFDDDAGRGFDRVRPVFFDPLRPPAASKVMVYGVGQAGRTLTMDMIAVEKEN